MWITTNAGVGQIGYIQRTQVRIREVAPREKTTTGGVQRTQAQNDVAFSRTRCVYRTVRVDAVRQRDETAGPSDGVLTRQRRATQAHQPPRSQE